jgi:hypothetical protein
MSSTPGPGQPGWRVQQPEAQGFGFSAGGFTDQGVRAWPGHEMGHDAELMAKFGFPQRRPAYSRNLTPAKHGLARLARMTNGLVLDSPLGPLWC